MLDPFADSDVCSLVLVVGLLFVIGNHVVQATPLRNTGVRIGFGGALAYFAILCGSSMPTSAETLLPVLLKTLLAGWLTTSISWIALPVAAFAYRNTIGRLSASVNRRLTWLRQEREARQRDQDEQERRRRAAAEWERQGPQRELARQQAELQAKTAAEEKRRREQARFHCEALFDLQAAEIEGRFSRNQFDQLVARYLGDDRPADDVERYAGELRLLVQRHADLVAPPPRFASLPQIAAHFGKHRAEIDALPYDEDVKDTLRIVIAKQEEDAIRELLRR